MTNMILPTDSIKRKTIPITTGLLDYFPLAVAEVANASYNGNLQHHADKPLHWDKTKSTDHADCIARHLIDRGKFDTDGVRHSAKLAWRALALLQLELDAEQNETYDLKTLERVQEIVDEVRDGVGLSDSIYTNNAAIVNPHLDAICDEIEYLKKGS